MRLIDADNFKNRFGYRGLESEDDILWNRTVRIMIENEPIAYDLDEVIKQVQKITERIFNYCEEIDNNIPENERSGYRLLPDIFMLRDVVKRGGLNRDVD